jgi:homoserine kinase
MTAMAFVTSAVRVRVPATSANLGPGFDALGLALTLYDEVTAQVTGGGVAVRVAGQGAGELPTDECHLVAASMLATFDRLGGRPLGLDLHCENRIPQARGLGSSSAAIVAGILLARELARAGNDVMDDFAVLRLAAELEGHPDNVAACLLGGLTIAWTTRPARGHGGVRAVRLEVADQLNPVLFVPPTRGLTTYARAILPDSVPHADATFNAARAALLLHALTGDPALLFDATEERLHQPYRAAAMPGTGALIRSLREAGIPAVLSGAGPAVLAFPNSPGEAGVRRGAAGDGRAGEVESLVPAEWSVMSLAVAPEGARILVAEHAEGDPVAAGLPR